ILSIAGVAISSFALCAVVSIMGGFGADLKHKILGNNAHISIDSTATADGEAPGLPAAAPAGGAGDLGHIPWDDLLDKVRVVPGVMAATPVVTGEAMASSQSNTAGVLIRGVDPVSIGSVIDLVKNIEVGKFEYLSEPSRISEMAEDEPIWIGRGGHRYLNGPRVLRRSDGVGGSPATDGLDDALDPDVADVVQKQDVYPGVVLGREL